MDVPDIEIVGVKVIASLKAAVMVTVSDAAKSYHRQYLRELQ